SRHVVRTHRHLHRRKIPEPDSRSLPWFTNLRYPFAPAPHTDSTIHGLLTNLLLLSVYLLISVNELSGNLPVELFKAQGLQSLVLYGNFLSGSIPNEIGDLKFLQILDFSRNSLNGSIPESILKCKRLRSFDLSQNNLTGSVPSGFASLGNSPEKVYVNLAYNNLSGPIPQTGALVNRGPTAFLGNSRLCGPPLKDPCLANTGDSPTSHPFVPENNEGGGGGSKKGEGLSKTTIVAIVVCDFIGISIVGFLFSCCYLKICARRNSVDEEGYVLEKEGKEKKVFFLFQKRWIRVSFFGKS
ncbi:unnamed protein product, partial [Arabidopsis halleri]